MLLASTHSTFQVDTILWLPMTHSERSRVLRWRLGWLPGGKQKNASFILIITGAADMLLDAYMFIIDYTCPTQ